MPRAAQWGNVVLCLHHVPAADAFPFSHAYFPRAAFDETVQRGLWTFGRKGDAFVALYSQHLAAWVGNEPNAEELRAPSRDNVWICEMGSRSQHGDFAAFVQAMCAAPVVCDGLTVRYQSPTVGEMRFGWTGPLTVAGSPIPLRDYPRFDSPYCRAEIGGRNYTVERDGKRLTWDFPAPCPNPSPATGEGSL